MVDTTIFFYSDIADGELSKKLAYNERKFKRGGLSRDASTFRGEEEEPNVVKVVLLPSVRPHHRQKIVAIYGDRVVDGEGATSEPTETASGETAPAPTGLTVVNRGGNRWFVMRGDERISGPHSKERAEMLAAQGQEA